MTTLEFKGIDKLMKRLDPQRTEADVRKVVKANGAGLQQMAMRKAAVDTGFMKRSIGLEIADSGFTATITPAAEYSPYLEYGTRFMSAQPFMRPAFMYQRYQFIKDLQKLMR
jgi:HK97 gp10 family phage protein